MMKRIFITALLVASFAPQKLAGQTAGDWWQPTSEVNQDLPMWLQFSGSYRIRAEDQDGLGFTSVSDTHMLGRLQIGVRIQARSWLTFFGQGQDARIYLNGPITKSPPNQNTWDLHQAWAELGSAEKHHVALRIGRQELNFGEQRLVGASPWLNSPRGFDAALATVSFAGWRVDTFASSVVNSVTGQLDHHKQGNPFYGSYGNIAKLVPKATIQPYVFWRLAPAGYAPAYANGMKGPFDEKTVGFRWVGRLPARFGYGAEIARQTGKLGSDSIGAWAGHWGIGRSFAVKLQPRLLAEYNFASGTANPASSHISTFDQLYPTGHDKFGMIDQVGWRNIRDIRTGVEFKVSPKLSLSGIYHDFRLAEARDGLYSATGAVVAKALNGTAGTHVGQELDAQSVYKWNRAMQIGLGFGHLFTGEFLQKTTPGKATNFSYAMVTYAF